LARFGKFNDILGLEPKVLREPTAVPLTERDYDQDKDYDISKDKDFLEEMKRHEGYRRSVYGDRKEIPTIGIGANLTVGDTQEILKDMGYDIHNVLSGQVELSDNEIMDLYQRQLKNRERLFESLRSKSFPGSEITPDEKRALMSLYFNSPKLIGPKMRKALATNDDFAAAKEILLGSNPGNVKGVQTRREAETKMFLGDRFDEFMESLTPEDLKLLAKRRKQRFEDLLKERNPQNIETALKMR
jgi:GH24 family phage-related lysozyme (muramidase)